MCEWLHQTSAYFEPSLTAPGMFDNIIRTVFDVAADFCDNPERLAAALLVTGLAFAFVRVREARREKVDDASSEV